MMLIKSLLIGFLIALGEVVNGNIRVRFLHKRFGLKRAKLISLFSGVAIIFLICWFLLPWIAPKDNTDCYLVGFSWLAVMLCLDIYFAKYVFKLKWNKIFDDFNLFKGNLLTVGMAFLFFSPIIVFSFYQ